MKHKNPAPQTREMDVLVRCHNTHLQRQTEQQRGCHPALGGVQAVPRSRGEPSSAQGRGVTPGPPARRMPVPVGENQLSAEPRVMAGTVLPRPAQLAGRTGCGNKRDGPETRGPRGFTLKPSGLQNRHENPRFSRSRAGARREPELCSRLARRLSPPLPAASLAASKELEIILLHSKEPRVRSFTVFFSVLLLTSSSWTLFFKKKKKKKRAKK